MSKFGLVVVLLAIPLLSEATHLMGGYITFKKQGLGHTYEVTVTAFLNLGSEIRFGDGQLDFGDGSEPVTTPSQISTYLRGGLGYVAYAVLHTFPESGVYRITYSEANLHAGIVNVTNSVETLFYLESIIILQDGVDSSSPDLLNYHSNNAIPGREYTFSSQAAGKPGDRISYFLTNPLPASNSGSYSFPGGVFMNSNNGLFRWSTLPVVGPYYFGIEIVHSNKSGKVLSHIKRTFLVILEDDPSELTSSNAVADPNGKVIVPAGEEKKYRFFLYDAIDPDWEVFYPESISDNVHLNQYDSSSGTNQIRVGELTFVHTEAIVAESYFPVTLRGWSVNGRFSIDFAFLFAAEDIPLPVITGVEKALTLRVYPNPFAGEIQIQGIQEGATTTFEILDVQGRVCQSGVVRQGEPIGTLMLPAGVYILRVTDGPTVSCRKIVKR